VDISDDALSLAQENRKRLHADNARFLKSDLFSALGGEHYDLIVTNPPYVTNAETDALPKEYDYEPELGLRAGDDGLDLALQILRDAPLHLDRDGLLICEVGEAETALVKLLPELPSRGWNSRSGRWAFSSPNAATSWPTMRASGNLRTHVVRGADCP
jgi:ribosomal protein L3 glutamine methyltransferase